MKSGVVAFCVNCFATADNDGVNEEKNVLRKICAQYRQPQRRDVNENPQ